MSKVKIGIIREEKNPPDSRVPLPPAQCRKLLDQYGDDLAIFVEPSPNRCFKDEEYEALGIPMKSDLSDCDILMGVKEVPKPKLIADKKYLFFSHTIKKQPYNRTLLQKIISQNIQLIDYECLRYENGKRILGFGHFAGIVGAHNGLLAYGKKHGLFDLIPAHEATDYAELKEVYKSLQLPAIKIVITGGGRVALGAKEVVDVLGIKEVSPKELLENNYEEAVYAMMDTDCLYAPKDGSEFIKKDFFADPTPYKSTFGPYTKVVDLMMNGIYWNPAAPLFFTKEDMQADDFKIRVIADITCDIEGSIPATLRATVIGDPTMGYDPTTMQEVAPYQAHTIDIMSVDNLPNELPRDASTKFGEDLIRDVIPAFFEAENAIIEGASITKAGDLYGKYEYLRDYVAQKV